MTLAELATKHCLHLTMIAMWKRRVIDRMAAAPSNVNEATRIAGDTEIEKLHAKIGQVVVEQNSLSKRFARSVSRDGGR